MFCFILTLNGCAYNVNSDNIFSQVDSAANIDYLNICKTSNNADVYLNKAFFDGISLYLKFKIKGYNIKIPETNPILKNAETNLCYWVDSFYITDTSGIVINGFNNIYDSCEKYNFLSNYNQGINTEDLLLPFENVDIDVNSTYKLTMHLNGLDEDIVFENLKFSNNEFYETDINKDNRFNILNAECFVKKIIYTKARTIIDIQWNISNMKKFSEEYLNNYSKNYQVYFSVGDFKEFFHLDPFNSPCFDNTLNEEKNIVCRYIFNVVSNINDVICIKEYYKVNGEPKGVPIKTIFSFNQNEL